MYQILVVTNPSVLYIFFKSNKQTKNTTTYCVYIMKKKKKTNK